VSISVPHLPLSSVLEPYHLYLSCSPSPSSIHSEPEVEDDYLTSKDRLHIALEVVVQLDNAEDFRWLSPEELSLYEFLVEQTKSLQMVVEAQDHVVMFHP
jgi:hypothetical protein